MSKEFESIYKVLEKVNVMCTDNGSEFTEKKRLKAIKKIAKGTDYKRIKVPGLFRLYSKVNFEKTKMSNDTRLIVFSAHVDCHPNIARCFTEDVNKNIIKGTFDNSITDAAAVYLMKEGNMPSNVVFAFTGDEENKSRGARDLSRYLYGLKRDFVVIVLDVTDEGFEQDSDFTLENDFANSDVMYDVGEVLEGLNIKYNYLPGNIDSMTPYIPADRRLPIEGQEDESWEYDEADICCFSICMPVKGDMHSNDGVEARKDSLVNYVKVIKAVAEKLAK